MNEQVNFKKMPPDVFYDQLELLRCLLRWIDTLCVDIHNGRAIFKTQWRE